MDEKVKSKELELIKMVSALCDDLLNEEYKDLSVKLVEKLGRKREVPFKRGKLEIWATSVVYTIGQINFLFDKSSNPYLSGDDLCSYYGTSKSTVSQKAKTIRDLLKLKIGNKEFSTKMVLENAYINGNVDFNRVKTLEGAELYSRIKNINSLLRK